MKRILLILFIIPFIFGITISLIPFAVADNVTIKTYNETWLKMGDNGDKTTNGSFIFLGTMASASIFNSTNYTTIVRVKFNNYTGTQIVFSNGGRSTIALNDTDCVSYSGGNPAVIHAKIYNGSSFRCARSSLTDPLKPDTVYYIAQLAEANNTETLMVNDISRQDIVLDNGFVWSAGRAIVLGKEYNNKTYLNGSLYEVEMFNFSLTPKEVRHKYYNEGQYVPILAYHDVNETAWTGGVSTAKFTEKMAWLRSQNYSSITMLQYYNWTQGQLSIPEKSVIITFDDGFNSTATVAYPIMEQYGFNATVYLATNFMNTTDVYSIYSVKMPMLNWTQVNMLRLSGWEKLNISTS